MRGVANGQGLLEEPEQARLDGDRAEVIRKYRRYLFTRPDLLAALPELTGQRLGCFCAPQACHADVLIAAWQYYVAEAHPLPPARSTSNDPHLA